MRTFAVPLMITSAALLRLPIPAHAQTVPDGWKTERSGEATLYGPDNLPSGKVYSVTVFPLQPRQGKAIGAWLRGAIEADPTKPGELTQPGKVEEKSEAVANANCLYKTDTGDTVAAMYYAIGASRGKARLVRVTLSQSADLIRQHKDATLRLVGEIVEADKRGSKTRNDEGDEEASAPSEIPAGARRGGELRLGTYSSNKFHGDGTVLGKYSLSLYANGEWRITNERGQEFKTGDYKYDPQTGKLDIDVILNLYNSRYDSDDEQCIYYRDAGGTPIIYAKDDYGIGTRRIILRYVGANAIAKAPTEEKEAKEKARAEARRFKWVKTPGKGCPPRRFKASSTKGRMLRR